MIYKKILAVLLISSVPLVSAMNLDTLNQNESPQQKLIRAIQDNKITDVREAINAGANTKEQLAFDPYNPDRLTTPLSFTISNGKDYEIAELLLQQGADQKELDALLKSVAYAGNPTLVELLVAYGARPNDDTMKGVHQALQNAQPPYTASPQDFKEIIDLLESLEPTQKLN